MSVGIPAGRSMGDGKAICERVLFTERDQVMELLQTLVAVECDTEGTVRPRRHPLDQHLLLSMHCVRAHRSLEGFGGWGLRSAAVGVELFG